MYKPTKIENAVLSAMQDTMAESSASCAGFSVEALSQHFGLPHDRMLDHLVHLLRAGKVEHLPIGLWRPKGFDFKARPNLRFKNRTHEE